MKRKDDGKIRRRDFLISAAGLAGSAVPVVGWAATPCPPPSLSVTGGSSAQSGCGAAPGSLPTLVLLGGGGGKPWTFGHVFRKGDVPSGQQLTASGPSAFQADVRNRWSDGSVKFAVLSGIGGTSVALSSTATAPSGTVPAISASDVGTTTVQLGSYGTVSLSTAITNGQTTFTAGNTGNKKWSAGRIRIVATGPVMREEHFYAPLPSDDHLAVFWYVRKYSNGSIEIETVVENGWYGVPGLNVKTYVPTITTNGSSRVLASVAQYYYTRWSQVDWIGTAPGITPQHNPAYVMSTKLVPNYFSGGTVDPAAFGPIAAANITTAAQAERPTPMSQGIWDGAPNAGGEGDADQKGVLPHWEALAVSTGDARAVNATIGHGRLLGRYSYHYRDVITMMPPKPSTNASLQIDPSSPTGGSNTAPDQSHLVSWAYLPYLLTGRWQFMELAGAMAVMNHFAWATSSRQNATGVLPGEPRARGWGLMRRAQAACITPDAGVDSFDATATQQYELRRLHSNNIGYHWDLQATATDMTNALGVVYMYHQYDGVPGVNSLGSAPWQQAFLAAAIGWSWDMDIALDATSRTKHQNLRDHVHKLIVGMMGRSSSGGFNWRGVNTYEMSYGTCTGGVGSSPASFYANWGTLYQANLKNYGVSGEPDTPGSAFLSGAFSGATTIDYIPMRMLQTLGWAVDHGAPGASAAWALVTGSAAWNASNANIMTTYPRYSIVPRL